MKHWDRLDKNFQFLGYLESPIIGEYNLINLFLFWDKVQVVLLEMQNAVYQTWLWHIRHLFFKIRRGPFFPVNIVDQNKVSQPKTVNVFK